MINSPRDYHFLVILESLMSNPPVELVDPTDIVPGLKVVDIFRGTILGKQGEHRHQIGA